MSAEDLRALIDRLNPPCRSTLERAAAKCKARGAASLELEDWLIELLTLESGDLAHICKHFGIDRDDLASELQSAVGRFATGSGRVPGLAPATVRVAKGALLLTELDAGGGRVRSGTLLAAALQDERAAPQLRESAPSFRHIDPETLRDRLTDIAATSLESDAPSDEAVQTLEGALSPVDDALGRFTVDLTALAEAGQLDPVIGRDAEIRLLIDVLCRRRQNNPILTGEAGVGKTAVAEGLAIRIAAANVPPSLRGSRLRSLDLGMLQAGASARGEFEARLRAVIDAVKASPQPVLLFIDEAHNLVGAGGQAGQGDAANLLKPALARGEFRSIAATTWGEYKKYFEKDAALTRRFQVVKVDEPSDDVATDMLFGLVETLERHHDVRITTDAVRDAVRLSRRYIPSRQLPEKAIGVLDTAAARVALTLHATPGPIEDVARRIEAIDARLRFLTRDNDAGREDVERIESLRREKDTLADELDSLRTRHERERALAERIHDTHAKLAREEHNDGPDDAERTRLVESLRSLEAELADIQGDQPLVCPVVDAHAVGEVVSSWTGIPVGRMLRDEITGVLELRQRLEQRVIGQSHALELIARSVRTGRAGLTDPRKPIGVFFLVGTSGVGKTETAVALADLLYGGEQNMTVINMSEFKEEHKVSLLMGSPPGYVGYGEGGVLTEAVRRRPYSVILLDEMEKAHPGVQDVFYQVFDKGSLRDGEGRDIDFRNTVIIMTSNAASDSIMRLTKQGAERPNHEDLVQAIYPELTQTFKPAFLGRVSIVPYFPLVDDDLRQIVRISLARVERRVIEAYGAAFAYDDDVLDAIVDRCREVETGARNIEHILGGAVLPDLSAQCLALLADGRKPTSVRIAVGPDRLIAGHVR